MEKSMEPAQVIHHPLPGSPITGPAEKRETDAAGAETAKINRTDTTAADRMGMEPAEQEKRIRHFSYFSIGSVIYAIFYTVCLYRNRSGITYPFFIGGTLFYFLLYLKRYGVSAKKDSLFYIAALLLLGISSFCTDDGSLLFMNKMGIFVLMFCFMIHSLYEDGKWSFSRQFGAVFNTVFGAVGALGRPFSDLGLYLKSRREGKGEKKGKGRYVALGLLISAPLLVVVLFLLGMADVVFASFINSVLENIRIPENLFGISVSLLFSFFAAYCIGVCLAKRGICEEETDKRVGEPVVAITVTGILSAVYLLFGSVQVIFLFFGGGKLPEGYTYAEYARQGFFQLLFVCVLNLVLVLVCLGSFKESKVLKGFLTLICLCTYIMIASSAMRMILYIKSYYLTFLRIFVLWALAVIFLLMTGVLVTVYKERFPLFRYSMVIVTVLYMGLSFGHPDYLIARVNLSQMFEKDASEFFDSGVRYSDIWYLRGLSADAAPALLAAAKENTEVRENLLLLKEAGNDVWWYSDYVEKMKEKGENMNLRTFNLSRYRAARLAGQIKSVSDF